MPKYSPRTTIGMAPPVNATTEELGAATVLFLAALALEDGVSQGHLRGREDSSLTGSAHRRFERQQRLWWGPESGRRRSG